MKKVKKTDTAKAAKAVKVDELKAMSKADILNRCAALEETIVPVKGWSGGVRMCNITFDKLVQISIDSAGDVNAKNAMTVAETCVDLEVSDAYKLQSGNGIQFGLLFEAVQNFLSCKLTDDKLKN